MPVHNYSCRCLYVSQLGPEKGVIHLASAAVINAIWDLWARIEDKVSVSLFLFLIQLSTLILCNSLRRMNQCLLKTKCRADLFILFCFNAIYRLFSNCLQQFANGYQRLFQDEILKGLPIYFLSHVCSTFLVQILVL